MKVLSHNSERVLLQVDNHVVKLIRLLDRYTATTSHSDDPHPEEVEIWEDSFGAVIRLSKRLGSQHTAWIAQPWV